jgi:inorganic pyrophosphatase
MEIDMVVEIPAGSHNKYEMDHEAGYIRLDRALSTATAYPTDYGFVPGTLAGDGDPIDALVLLDPPTFPGCVVRVRPVAMFWMRDEHGPDGKVLCVPVGDDRYDNVDDLDDLSPHLRAEISHFFDVYKQLEPGKETEVCGWNNRAEAEKAITEGYARARDGGQ